MSQQRHPPAFPTERTSALSELFSTRSSWLSFVTTAAAPPAWLLAAGRRLRSAAARPPPRRRRLGLGSAGRAALYDLRAGSAPCWGAQGGAGSPQQRATAAIALLSPQAVHLCCATQRATYCGSGIRAPAALNGAPWREAGAAHRRPASGMWCSLQACQLAVLQHLMCSMCKGGPNWR